MSFNIDEMEDNILHAIAVAKEKHKVECKWLFFHILCNLIIFLPAVELKR